MNIYPKRLIPNSQYRHIKQTDLLTQSGLVLIRHIESDKVQRIADSNLLHPDCIQIQSDHLRDLSNNLLGIFKKEDVFWGIKSECKGVFCALWEENVNGLIPRNDECFKDEGRGFFFIPIDKLLNCNLPEVQEQKCHFMLFHTPTKCNFWHVSLRLLNSESIEISELNLSKGKKHKIWKSAKDFLLTDVITQSIDKHTIIPQECYMKEL